MKTLVRILTTFLVALPSWVPAQTSHPQGTPTEVIHHINQQCTALHLSPQLTAQQEQENATLKKTLLEETFDIQELSRLALGQHWTSLSLKDQNHFVELLRHLLERRAIFAAEHAREKKCNLLQISYLGDTYLDEQGTQALTKTKVFLIQESLTLEMNYKLKRTSAGWKIYDVIVDGASLLENYRFQFDKIIVHNGFGDLIERMEKKWESLQP